MFRRKAHEEVWKPPRVVFHKPAIAVELLQRFPGPRVDPELLRDLSGILMDSSKWVQAAAHEQ